MSLKYPFLLLLLFITACTPSTVPDQPAAITVMAAASLTAPFQEIGRTFERQHPGARVNFNFAGSQQLAQQLAQGAPADVFASASIKYMDAAVSAGRVAKGSARPFVKNRLVVIYPQENRGGISALGDLAKPGLKLDLAAKEVPVGQYSLDFLDKAQKDAVFPPTYKDQVLKNVVSYEDNVKAVVTKVSLGEADAGIVYTSDLSGDAAQKVARLDIPDSLNIVAVYPLAAVTDSHHPDLAKAFVDLVLSQAGQAILSRYGFTPIQ